MDHLGNFLRLERITRILEDGGEVRRMAREGDGKDFFLDDADDEEESTAISPPSPPPAQTLPPTPLPPTPLGDIIPAADRSFEVFSTEDLDTVGDKSNDKRRGSSVSSILKMADDIVNEISHDRKTMAVEEGGTGTGTGGGSNVMDELDEMLRQATSELSQITGVEGQAI